MKQTTAKTWPLWLAPAILACAGCQSMRGEPWTIECLELAGPDHRANAAAIADVLRATKGIDADKVNVRHTEHDSKIYYGRYLREIDRLEGVREIPEDLKRDLEMIKELYDDRGRRIFLAARMVPVQIEDKGPPEWNLENADGEYSLQVAVFFPTPEVRDFKKAAVAYARHLRGEGYEAYYHHGRSKSIVTVGVFGPDAVTREGNAVGYSEEVRELQRQENFKYNLTNGAIWTASVDGEKAPVRSLLVRIPKEQDEAF
jgi:hypothetical protein